MLFGKNYFYSNFKIWEGNKVLKWERNRSIFVRKKLNEQFFLLLFIIILYNKKQKRKKLFRIFFSRSFFSEKGGFEPPVVFQLRRFSKPMHSTTLPPFLFYFFCLLNKAGNAIRTRDMHLGKVPLYH